MCIYGVFRPQFHLQLNLGLFFIFACASHTYTQAGRKGHKWPEWVPACNWEWKVAGAVVDGGSGSGRNRKERGKKRIKRGRWNEKLSYESRLHV